LENINLKEIFVCGVDLKTKNAFVAWADVWENYFELH
jgi:hypothetical protein